MVLDINMLRQTDRDGGGVATSETVCSEGQQGFRQEDNVFEKALQGVLLKCKAAPDYSTANIIFNSNARTLRLMGCPEELINLYDDEVALFYAKKNEKDDMARNLIELFMDNHGNINNHNK